MPNKQIQSQDISAQRAIPPIVTYPDLKPVFNIKFNRSTLQRKENKGTFPKRVFLDSNRIGWKSEDILAWIEGLNSVTYPGQKTNSINKVSTMLTTPVRSSEKQNSSELRA